MDRRSFLSGAALSVAGGAFSRAARAETQPGWRRFEITTRVTLLDAPGAAQLWLPLAQTAGGYQAGLDLRWQSSGHADVVPDSTYGADILRVLWDGASHEPRTVDVVQTVATRDRDGADRVLPVTEAERRFWLQPTETTPIDGIVRDTAARIVAGKSDPRARLRAIYDWVVDNTSRNPATPGCGLGDIRAMLESGNLAGKCADINGLMTGLAERRASRRATSTASASPPPGDSHRSVPAVPSPRRSIAGRRSISMARAGSRSTPPTCARWCWSRSSPWTARRSAPCATSCSARGR